VKIACQQFSNQQPTGRARGAPFLNEREAMDVFETFEMLATAAVQEFRGEMAAIAKIDQSLGADPSDIETLAYHKAQARYLRDRVTYLCNEAIKAAGINVDTKGTQ
jgi:hypothetical protein